MTEKKRALILAGGGIKVAFQAGVLQVWLDEAKLDFDLADGASGGVFNLAMYCQGMSGTEIADNWRTLEPSWGVDINWPQMLKFLYAESMFELDSFRSKVFPHWGLNWDKIRAHKKPATFNVYNFSKHELEVIDAGQMNEDYLVAGVSLPMWFPPVVINGDTYIDPVYITDANLDEAIRRGADELWIVWTVSDRGEWNDGFVANYFQIIETASYGRFKQDLKRIERNNEAVARGEHGEFGRHIAVKLLKEEVPLHYLINLSRDRMEEAVNQGVKSARLWCEKEGIALSGGAPDYPTEVLKAKTNLEFTEEMKGFITLGDPRPAGERDRPITIAEFEEGQRKGKEKKDDNYLMFRLTLKVEDVDRFVVHPDHEARAEGYVECEALGGKLPVEKGDFNLFTHGDDYAEKRMLYRLFFADGAGNPLTLSGFKDIRDDPGLDLWSDTTTLFTTIYRGHVGADEEKTAEVVAHGVIRIYLLDFAKQITTFRLSGGSFTDRASAATRFGQLFFGKLWDVYAREFLSAGAL